MSAFNLKWESGQANQTAIITWIKLCFLMTLDYIHSGKKILNQPWVLVLQGLQWKVCIEWRRKAKRVQLIRTNTIFSIKRTVIGAISHIRFSPKSVYVHVHPYHDKQPQRLTFISKTLLRLQRLIVWTTGNMFFQTFVTLWDAQNWSN